MTGMCSGFVFAINCDFDSDVPEEVVGQLCETYRATLNEIFSISLPIDDPRYKEGDAVRMTTRIGTAYVRS